MSTVVYTLPRLFSEIGETPKPAGIYSMKRISDFFNHSGDDNAEPMMPEILELEKHWTSISDKLAKLQADISAARGPQSSSLLVDNVVSVETLTRQQEILINRLADLTCLLGQLKVKLAKDQQPRIDRTGVDLLFSKQKTLLERIRELNIEIQIISSVLSNNNNNNLVDTPSAASSNEFVDLVVRANPSRPPYSLPLIKKHLEERLGLEIFATTHVHSAVAQDSAMTENLKHFISCSDPKLQRSKAQLAITLIWTKGDEEAALMVSPSSQSVAIRGESNLARFILRRYPALLDYEGSDLHRTAHLDHLLDLSELITGVNKKERAAALKMLEKPLTSGSGPSIVTGVSQLNPVDFVLYSAVINSSNPGELGQPCRAWLDRCRGPV